MCKVTYLDKFRMQNKYLPQVIKTKCDLFCLAEILQIMEWLYMIIGDIMSCMFFSQKMFL